MTLPPNLPKWISASVSVITLAVVVFAVPKCNELATVAQVQEAKAAMVETTRAEAEKVRTENAGDHKLIMLRIEANQAAIQTNQQEILRLRRARER